MAKNEKNNLREAKIFSLAQVVDRCIVVVEEVGGPRLVPIWIGIFEGGAIAAELTGQEPPRPMTHDLMSAMLKAAHIDVEKIVITDLADNTYFAEIHLKTNGSTTVMDSRPSDALALAVRAHCPMYVSEAVFKKCPELLKPITDDEVKSFKEELKNMKPEDFFKDLKKGKGPGPKDPPPPPSQFIHHSPAYRQAGLTTVDEYFSVLWL